ncbi:MAG: serine protease [Actinomycetota bacterium]|jgi:hypothetical protein|nr:serine protease [Actinomycetota bacterium]
MVHPVRRRRAFAHAAWLIAGVAILVAGTQVPARAAVPSRAASPISRPAAPVQRNPRKFLGVVPSARALHAQRAALTPPLLYHNGPVQHSSKVFPIYWAPPGHYIPPSYIATINQYFTDVAHDSFKTSNVYATDTQYYDIVNGVKHFVSYSVAFGGAIVDTQALPASGCPNYTLGDGSSSTACLTDAQLKAEISRVVNSRSLPTGLGTEFFLFTPPRVASCFAANSLASGGCYDPQNFGGFCAYHSNINTSPVRLYANMPFADISGCNPGQFPNGDTADPTLNVVSHEHNETITDPLGTAWFDSSGNENGDECNFNFGASLGNNGFGSFNQVINADDYWLQQEWSNRTNSCRQRNTFAQPTASFAFSPSSPVHGNAVTFTSTVSDSDDTSFTFSWTFGDGGTSTLKNPTHTYATAGTRTVTLVVFDAKGDQVRVTRTVSVS